MAVDNSLSSLLTTLADSVQSATEVLPDNDNIVPPKEGISLLDLKNDLFLSYLQNLVFLILLKLRSRNESDRVKEEDALKEEDRKNEVVQTLVELRVYLDKGVRPLENRLKYQIDNIVRAADDATRKSIQASEAKRTRSAKAQAKRGAGSDESDAESVGSAQTEEDMEDVTYGPNARQFARSQDANYKRGKESSKDGIYRPPKITPMAMPTTQGREEKETRRAGRSTTLDEFVATELSTAPLAEPSIGSTIVSGGRRVKSDRERREEAERREYEESNFTRLPATSKKEKAKLGRNRQGGFGGEEWRGLGAGLDRIERLTQKKGGSLGSLEKSRKRPISDGPRGSGMDAGDAFEKRRKVVSRYRK
ncbi:Sas10/Utp3/C1D family-domain-containing protein [Lophiotrema nucula]|uniref:Sas10/Utp3/C1D family-domain-containing protein n=1 Tax=Lophiotrema nucula TaxID=690887 RepID=A0A6A5Z804_9PLEO|nr:Sas10/Utp3/C1D family-domain-containing protein [Lophiotrema nucula]